MEDLLKLWIPSVSEPNEKLWFSVFRGTYDLSRFESTLNDGLEGKLTEWESSNYGKVTLCILYSYIPRFLYKGTSKIFCADKQAQKIADSFAYSEEASKLPILYQYFLLEPYYFSEDLEKTTKASIKLDEIIETAVKTNENEKIIRYLRKRKANFDENIGILKRFDRFPHRNKLLERIIKLEETLWLQSKSSKIFLYKVLEPKQSKPKKQENSQIPQENKEKKNRKLKILAFHGMKQNSVFFRSRTTKLRIALRNFAEITFANGPFQYSENDNGNNNDLRCWWETNENEYKGLDETISYVENLFATEGPFDGILGFSQGAGLCGILASIQPLRSIQFSFLIEISGFVARPLPYHNKIKEGISNLPSVHIIGLDDKIISPERTLELANCFKQPNAIISRHEGGHFTPNKWPLNTLAIFIKEQYEKIQKEEEKTNKQQNDIRKLEPIINLEKKLEKIEYSLPYGLQIQIRDYLFNNEKEENKYDEIIKIENISYEKINLFYQSIILHNEIMNNISKKSLIEDLLSISWSFKKNSLRKSENLKNKHFYYSLLSIYNIILHFNEIDNENLQFFIEIIPTFSSWRDLIHLLLIQYDLLLTNEDNNKNNISNTMKVSPLYKLIVQLFVHQLKEDQNIKNQLLTNDRYYNSSIGQLKEDGLWPSKCAEEAPRIKLSIDKKLKLAKTIAIELNPLHFPKEYNENDKTTHNLLNYTKGICYSRYSKLLSSISKIRKRSKKTFFENETNKHKLNTLHSKLSIELWNELLLAPISSEILHPRPQPVVPCDLDQLDPLLDWLQLNEKPKDQTAFTKGTIVPDGRLDLCKQVIGPKGIDPLLISMDGNEQVKRLLLGNNIIGDHGAKSIANAIKNNSVPNMDTWYIAGNDITDIGIQPICEALYNNNSVKSLWLKRNPLKPSGVLFIGRLLENNSFISTLDLDNCGVFDEGTSILMNSLKNNSTLKNLYLSVNGITLDGVSSISDYLSSPNSYLETLFLSVNRIGDDGCKLIANSFKSNKNLRRLSLASNRISDIGVNYLVDGLLDSNHPLQFLDLGFTKSTWAVREIGNRIGDDGAKSLARLLDNNKTLHSLYLKNNCIGDEGIRALCSSLENNFSLTSIGTSQFYSDTAEAEISFIHEAIDRNKKLLPGLEEIDLPEHVNEIYSVYRTKSAANQPFIHKFNWLQAADLDLLVDQ